MLTQRRRICRATYILDYWPEVYVKPYVRCGPYVVGSMLGHILYKHQNTLKLHKVLQ